MKCLVHWPWCEPATSAEVRQKTHSDRFLSSVPTALNYYSPFPPLPHFLPPSPPSLFPLVVPSWYHISPLFCLHFCVSCSPFCSISPGCCYGQRELQVNLWPQSGCMWVCVLWVGWCGGLSSLLHLSLILFDLRCLPLLPPSCPNTLLLLLAYQKYRMNKYISKGERLFFFPEIMILSLKVRRETCQVSAPSTFLSPGFPFLLPFSSSPSSH